MWSVAWLSDLQVWLLRVSPLEDQLKQLLKHGNFDAARGVLQQATAPGAQWAQQGYAQLGLLMLEGKNTEFVDPFNMFVLRPTRNRALNKALVILWFSHYLLIIIWRCEADRSHMRSKVMYQSKPLLSLTHCTNQTVLDLKDKVSQSKAGFTALCNSSLLGSPVDICLRSTPLCYAGLVRRAKVLLWEKLWKCRSRRRGSCGYAHDVQQRCLSSCSALCTLSCCHTTMAKAHSNQAGEWDFIRFTDIRSLSPLNRIKQL